MTFNRVNQLSALDKLYSSGENDAVIFYSAPDGDIHETVKEFLAGKDFFYYKSVQASPEEQIRLFTEAVNGQLTTGNVAENTYAGALKAMLSEKCTKRVIVIDEFQYIVKFSDELITEILKCINNKWGNQPVLFILTSTNMYFVENHIVDKLKEAAYEISGIIKLNDLSFTDIVSYFDKYSTEERILTYGILGGRAGRIKCFDPKLSVKDNIIKYILDKKSFLYLRGLNLLPPELREHSVYNTILFNLANGHNKLNDLHNITGYSRAKVSVYLGNLMEHELVEKLESVESDGYDNALKGVYAIKDSFLAFFYRFIYSNISMLDVLAPEQFYKTYIAPYLYEYSQYAYKKVCREYMMLLNKMGKLPVKISNFGMWLGKVGNIDIVATDDNGHAIIGACEFTKEKMTFEDLEWLMFCVKQAKLNAAYYYLFSKGGFDERVRAHADEAGNLVLIDMGML